MTDARFSTRHPQAGSVETTDLQVPITADDHIEGANAAPVTLVEYGDYECPYCGRAYPLVKRLQKELGDQLRFVFRNFPLRESHPHAEHAAEAAEAAGAQGKFWEMHDYLYEHQQALDDAHLRQYAEVLGLNLERFEVDMSQHRYADRVEKDEEGGIASGVPGTPTFFINGAIYEGGYDHGSLLDALRDAAA